MSELSGRRRAGALLRGRRVAALLALAVAGCGTRPGDHAVEPAGPAGAMSDPEPAGAEIAGAAIRREDVPASMRPCWGCHEEVVRAYLGHGMAASAGPVGTVPDGVVINPESGNRYEVTTVAGSGGGGYGGNGDVYLDATFADGGRRRQRLVGRIGAGRFDVSWAAAEVDLESGETTGRLFFAPVELVTGHGWALSPFELRPPAAGVDLALTGDCLGCHVARGVNALPGAARFPANQLGADAFEHLGGIRCEICHGDSRRHRELMAGLADDAGAGGGGEDELGLTRLGALAPAAQRDLCGRCHLQGDARITLIAGPSDRDRPLPAQVPVLVPATGPHGPEDDFRFVGQLERLALATCYRASPAMTCTTCHDPHLGAAAQGTASFDRACLGCHQDDCVRPAGLLPEAVTGAPGRSADGCVDCHVRRSQPFDLPHVRSADHWIRRRIPMPEDDIPHRAVADPDGALELFDRQRLMPQLASAAGRRWERGVLALGLTSLGRVEEALAGFDAFAPPGSPAAVEASAPAGLEPLERKVVFHETRALVLLAGGRFDEAERAFGDALEIDPTAAGALLGRARLRLGQGDVLGVLQDTQRVIDAYPLADHPWDLRWRLAARVGRPDLARTALLAAVRSWPSEAGYWRELGRLEAGAGNETAAREALARARLLRPSLFEEDDKGSR